MIKSPALAVGWCTALLLASTWARADAVSDFYTGKTVNLVIGYPPGGGYDLYARTLARHIGRHIPGNPAIVVQNMPGAGSIKAANFLYAIAPKDGLTFGGFSRGAFIDPLLGRGDGTLYDARRFSWVGSISNEVGVCAFRSAAGIRSWADMQRKPFIVGATGAGADSDVFPTVLRKMFKLPIKLVAGYGSSAEVVIAIKRGEVDGRCGWSWSSIKTNHPQWVKDGTLKLLVQLSLAKHADLPDVPLIMDLVKNPEHEAILRVVFARQVMGRPFLAPPGLPAERIAALRAAFMATMKDPKFLAETDKLKLEINPVSGEAVQQLVAEIYRTPPEILRKAVEVQK